MATAQTDTVRSQRWSTELRAMATQLEQKHPALYHHTSKEQFSRQLESLSASAATRDDAAMLVGVLQLIASAGDAHTSVGGNYQALGFRRLPVAFYLFDDGLFIVDADTSISKWWARVLFPDGCQPTP
jgi:hypothetical protein